MKTPHASSGIVDINYGNYISDISTYKRLIALSECGKLSEAMTSNDLAGQLISENWYQINKIKVLYF